MNPASLAFARGGRSAVIMGKARKPAFQPGLRDKSAAAAPTSFEDMVVCLSLTPDQYVGSAELKECVRRNRSSKCVPITLLHACGFKVDDEQ